MLREKPSITPTAYYTPGKGTADLFLHITSNYKSTGYDILPDYGVFDIFKNPDIPRALEDYKRHLEKHCL
jgi:NADPH dehydrogenase (quinone)